jgi:phenylpropionate dioxygenase-like ring-hydroxylating dioxygenase large terminal subunit
MREDWARRPLEMEDIPWGSKFLVRFDNKETGTEALGDERTLSPAEVNAGSGFVGPNQMITWINFSEENKFSQYFFEAPVNEGLTRVFFVNMRSFMLEPENDQRLTKVNAIVAQEDIDILGELDPVRTPPTPSEEVLIRSDGAVSRYREGLREWTERGWRVDMRSLREQKGDRAFAIPCPARRTSKNWVQKTIPLLPEG